MRKDNIFNIPSNYHFFLSLFNHLDKNHTNLDNIILFLPNRRSCREFKKLFLQKNKSSILPKLQAISDISYEDFFNLKFQEDSARSEIQNITNELLENKVLSKSDYLFFLSKEIQNIKLFGDNLEFEQAFKIAIHLQNLFNDLESEEISLNSIKEIDDSNLSLHRQFTLEFLKNFYIQIKNSLLKKNIISSQLNHNLIIDKYIDLLNNYNTNSTIIIAGSTGSLPYSRKLIKAISQQKNGQVILCGWQKIEEDISEENYSQFFLNQLIIDLAIEKKQIIEIKEEEFLLSDENRKKMVSLMMLPSSQTIKWQTAKSALDVTELSRDLENNLQLIEAENEIEEAKIITQILLQNHHKKSAIISNNNRLIDLLKLNLNNNSISFNDSRNIGIINSKLINFLLLILELLSKNFNSNSLLALLKHPLCIYNLQQKTLIDFEIKIIRQQRNKEGFESIKSALKIINCSELNKFFDDFYEDISVSRANNDLASHSLRLIKIAENLSKKSFFELLNEEKGQLEIFEFFEKLKLQNDIELKSENIFTTFKMLFSQVSYFEKSNIESSIDILSTIEARLLNFDLIIIASLNEGDFPENVTDNWLGRKIRKDLKIDKNLKRIGQNAFDFCNYLSNKSVVLTRSEASNGAILMPSPFLLKLKVFCKKINIELKNKSNNFLVENLQDQNAVEIEAANPKPDIKYRPKKISITEIAKLISDPYSIYAKKILKLQELQKIDFEPSYAQFGSFVHKALEEFVKNENNEDFLNKAKNIFREYFLNDSMEIVWWPKFENIFNNFLKENNQLNIAKNYLEVPIKLAVGDYIISGKIDRIINGQNGVEIFDYKTGQVATKNEVFSGIDPQLTISALALVDGLLESSLKNVNLKEIKSLNYWKLSALSKSEIKTISDDNEEIILLISAAKSGLKRLFEYFSFLENGYIAAPDKENYKKNEYWRLARILI